MGLRLAHALQGEIVNADSMQVYRDLRVLSARPSPKEEGLAAHHLFGHVDAMINYSVGMWLKDAARALDDVRSRGKLAIFCGGTGMYFKALTQGLSAIPAVPEAVRAKVRQEAEGVCASRLHDRLAMIDPKMAARLRPSDPQRILRALEVFAATGRSLADFQGARAQPLLAPDQWRAVFLAPERDCLRAAIDRRFEAMLAAGAIDEAAGLLARGLDPLLPAMRAHGAPHLMAHLRGEMTLAQAAERGKADTRAYAKRQFTFARHQLPDFAWAEPREAEARLLQTLDKSDLSRAPR